MPHEGGLALIAKYNLHPLTSKLARISTICGCPLCIRGEFPLGPVTHEKIQKEQRI
uniref:Uncharacterized protein n=1 Tax=Nelumbo nucifera TaxID=4432 RepID=A0A822YDN0_NELNU|nr:TPA_asm: hypothetical protein HUJ06_031210 [Nelumbo nucifera]DAD30240.1 TPA_asm: hypothetical protein HUJ06_031708 [Nelumbo nucifera]DAD30253.1 TPA_asm: hypothetical protein HUJ06_031721 [Nelumbo nucifera]DAD30255.1 TPA_asm: hypothetical protein HUJ06_031723 [Nelumbo nucifera]